MEDDHRTKKYTKKNRTERLKKVSEMKSPKWMKPNLARGDSFVSTLKPLSLLLSSWKIRVCSGGKRSETNVYT